MPRIPPKTWAALTYALAAVAPIGSWLLLLFYAMPSNRSVLDGATDMLQFTFSAESPDRWWFVGWAVLPVLLIGLSVAYLSQLPLKRTWALALFLAAAAVTLYSLFAVPSLGFALLLPAYLSYRCINGA